MTVTTIAIVCLAGLCLFLAVICNRQLSGIYALTQTQTLLADHYETRLAEIYNAICDREKLYGRTLPAASEDLFNVLVDLYNMEPAIATNPFPLDMAPNNDGYDVFYWKRNLGSLSPEELAIFWLRGILK